MTEFIGSHRSLLAPTKIQTSGVFFEPRLSHRYGLQMSLDFGDIYLPDCDVAMSRFAEVLQFFHSTVNFSLNYTCKGKQFNYYSKIIFEVRKEEVICNNICLLSSSTVLNLSNVVIVIPFKENVTSTTDCKLFDRKDHIYIHIDTAAFLIVFVT